MSVPSAIATLPSTSTSGSASVNSVTVRPCIAVAFLQPPRHEPTNQFRYRGALTFGQSAQRLRVVMVEPDDLIVPELLAQTVLPRPIPIGHRGARSWPGTGARL